MPSNSHSQFKLHSHDRAGVWESNATRYRTYAHELLAELERLCTTIHSQWPVDAGSSIRDESRHGELWRLVRIRDQKSDSVRIYAAMAIEGFLNFYGVLRLGQDVYDDHFERLGIVPKLRTLLLVSNQTNVPKKDQLCLDLDAVAQSRNALVHPKTREVAGDPLTHERSYTEVPGAARRSVEAMESFFSGFVAAVPAIAQHLNLEKVPRQTSTELM